MTPYGMTEREYVQETIAIEERNGRTQSAQYYRDYLDSLDFMDQQDAREALRIHAGIRVSLSTTTGNRHQGGIDQ